MSQVVSRNDIQNIIVAGKSGAGKQPRIDVLVNEFGLTQLSTGNIFREYVGIFDRSGFEGDLERFYDAEKDTFVPDQEIIHAIKEQVEDLDDPRPVMLGLKAKYFMNTGKFVPNNSTNELFTEYFSKGNFRGYVLDGYPRTPDQAEYLLKLCKEKGVNIDMVVLVNNADRLIIKRTMGRRICPSCKKVYHTEFKPSKDGIHCDNCGAEIIQRSDDTAEKIQMRLAEYYDKVIPMMSILEDARIPVVTVDGNLEVFTDENVKLSVMEKVGPLLE
ncbi:MAG: nucleoside monophosphate kinase [Candidatus Thermoplasmatota archaeon]|nr:nucleoside monophosphate kinase [Candidatus Thermoplasmatota archaeon]